LTRHLAFDYGPRACAERDLPGRRRHADAARRRGARRGEHRGATAATRAQASVRVLHADQTLVEPRRAGSRDRVSRFDDASYINGVALDVNGGLFMA
jgi:hypothetical protein